VLAVCHTECEGLAEGAALYVVSSVKVVHYQHVNRELRKTGGLTFQCL
jgi:hypothetical protein